MFSCMKKRVLYILVYVYNVTRWRCKHICILNMLSNGSTAGGATGQVASILRYFFFFFFFFPLLFHPLPPIPTSHLSPPPPIPTSHLSSHLYLANANGRREDVRTTRDSTLNLDLFYINIFYFVNIDTSE